MIRKMLGSLNEDDVFLMTQYLLNEGYDPYRICYVINILRMRKKKDYVSYFRPDLEMKKAVVTDGKIKLNKVYFCGEQY